MAGSQLSINMLDYSVLMTVYAKDNPDYARLSLDSILNQTVRTNDFVLVCDGPLSAELDALIEKYVARFPDLFNVVRLKENVGLGAALRAGVLLCKNELVARMDDDDISKPERCERQLKEFEKNDQLSVVGSYMDEFEEDYARPLRTKSVPSNFDEIKTFSRRRNPFNHSTVMFRKSSVIGAGNYSEMRTNQDVELWVRMINSGYIGYNISESLVLFRFDQKTYQRRKDWTNVKLMIDVWKGFRKKKYCSYFDYLVVFWSQIIIYLMPVKLLTWVYNHLR